MGQCMQQGIHMGVSWIMHRETPFELDGVPID